MNEQLPILLISGKDDPFGDYGKGIRKLGKKFKRWNKSYNSPTFMQIEDMKFYLKMKKK